MRRRSRCAPGGLLPHPFTLTFGRSRRRFAFCCTGLLAAYGPRYPSFQKDSLLSAVRTFLERRVAQLSAIAHG